MYLTSFERRMAYGGFMAGIVAAAMFAIAAPVARIAVVLSVVVGVYFFDRASRD